MGTRRAAGSGPQASLPTRWSSTSLPAFQNSGICSTSFSKTHVGCRAAIVSRAISRQ